MMTKKHFIELADTIKARHWEAREGAGLFIHDLADFCQDQNPRFNRQRWLDYIDGKCGPNGGSLTKGRNDDHHNEGGRDAAD